MAKPGPTKRKIVVPIVGPRPIIVISRSPRSRRNLTSTSRAWAIGGSRAKSTLLALGGPADGLQIHEGIVELRHIAQDADGPRGSDADRYLDVQQVLRQHSISIRASDPQTFPVDLHADALDQRLRPRRRFDRPLDGGRIPPS